MLADPRLRDRAPPLSAPKSGRKGLLDFTLINCILRRSLASVSPRNSRIKVAVFGVRVTV